MYKIKKHPGFEPGRFFNVTGLLRLYEARNDAGAE